MKKEKLEELKEKASELFDLPKEITLNLPKISMIGNNQMYIENHKGIIEYTQERIRINSASGVIRIEGKNMIVKNIASEEIIITGNINKIEFL